MASAGNSSSGRAIQLPPPRPPIRLLRRPVRSLVAAALLALARPALAAPPARLPAAAASALQGDAARPAPPPVSPPASQRTVEIRVALSATAAHALSEPRVRRLIQIETESFATVAPGATGPLGDHVAIVWVEQPSAAKVVVEVRVGDHPLLRREIAVRGLAGDVAARLVAIAVSDMVRAGMAPRPAPPPPPPPPPRRTPDEIERARRPAPALIVTPGADVAALPAAAGVAGGPSLAFAFRRFGVSESIFGRWLTGPARGSGLRWLEIGLSAEYRLWLGRSFRLGLGGLGAFSSVHLADATGVEGQPGQRESWSARAGGVVAGELRLATPVWLSLRFEPGAVLRPVHFTSGSGGGTVEGVWLGFGLALHLEKVFLSEP